MIECNPVARSRPPDSEIIDVIALAFNVPNSVAAEWLTEMDAARIAAAGENAK